jgi:predicted SAM-dependent methyltransferase
VARASPLFTPPFGARVGFSGDTGGAHREAGLTGEWRVNLGCGGDLRSGWLNIDFTPDGQPTPRVGELINHDLREGLPLPPGSCSYIYTSHLLEHLSAVEGTRLMRDCHAALRRGGIMRVCLPDFRQALKAYQANDRGYFDLFDEHLRAGGVLARDGRPMERPTLMTYVNHAVYQDGEHKCMYDGESILALMTEVGLTDARLTTLDPSIDITDPLRARYSFYAQASHT